MGTIVSPSARKPKKTSQPPKPRSQEAAWESSQPEIRVGYTPAGRETLEAITAEVTGELDGNAAPALAHAGPRAPQVTLPYADRISNAPGSQKPSRTAPEHTPSAPEISVRQAPAGRETLAAIELELLGKDEATQQAAPATPKAPAPAAATAEPAASPATESIEIFEMATFVVRGPEAARLSTEALRRRFVEEHLMHRLPIASSDQIDRVDVTPWTVRGTFVVRVWCRIPPAPA